MLVYSSPRAIEFPSSREIISFFAALRRGCTFSDRLPSIKMRIPSMWLYWRSVSLALLVLVLTAEFKAETDIASPALQPPPTPV